MKFHCPFILASGSPRRKQLLLQLGMDFQIHVSDADESFDAGTKPALIAKQIASRKVETVSAVHPEALTLAADTIVVLDGKVLGKPETTKEAIEMLSQLRNKQHFVYTGLALSHPATNRRVTAHEKTAVFFGNLSDEEISTYVDGGSPMDKAGAYGIQDDRGALFVSRIEGDFYNVVGLPLHRLYEMVKQHFSDLLH